MRVSEIFRSLQGEGVLIGTPTVFIRTVGCNLECSWCDTEYSREGGEELSIEQIMTELEKHKTQFICLTAENRSCRRTSSSSSTSWLTNATT
jgi:7-carboxy-7-deazaguanine synthase